MRFVPLLLALLVSVSLYFLVLERPRLLGFARVAEGEQVAALPDTAAPVTLAATSAATPERRVGVVVQKSAARSIDNAVLIRGRTEAARQVEVRAETAGQVISDPLRRGAFVQRGETLCELSPGTRGATLAEAEARLAEAQINARAAEQLSEGGFGSETRAAGARAALQSAQAAVEAAQTEITRLTITAPFDGMLETDAAETGGLLQPGGLCATVIQLDPIRLVGFVPETDVARIEVGAQAGGRLTTGAEVRGRVTFLSRAADEATRTFRVEVQVPNADLVIRSGQTAEMLIASDGVSAHLVPASALTLDDAGRLGVQTVREGRAAFAQVAVLRDTVEGMWVTGLEEEAEVIVVGQEYVTDGASLAVTYREARQ